MRKCILKDQLARISKVLTCGNFVSDTGPWQPTLRTAPIWEHTKMSAFNKTIVMYAVGARNGWKSGLSDFIR